MTKTVKKEKPEKGDVLEMARERLDYAMENYDTIITGFSGGKDSGTTLHLTLEAHERAGRDDLIHAVHIDDEVVLPETEEYVKQIAQHPRVKMWWCCLPVRYSNGCSSDEHYWYPWNPEEQDKWVREMPREFCEETENCELVTLDHPRVTEEEVGGYEGFKFGESEHKDLNKILFHRWNQSQEFEYGLIGNVIGIRTAESLTRLRGVLSSGGWVVEKMSRLHYLKPIYDWKDHDLWLAHRMFDWDYNEAYDKLAKAGVSRGDWRTAQPFGTEPLRGLDYFKRAWPDLWDRAMHRVPGATAANEWHHELYQARRRAGETWKDAAVRYWRNIKDEEVREFVMDKMESVLRGHNSHSTQPLPQETGCPYCEWSWKRIASNNAGGARKWEKGNK